MLHLQIDQRLILWPMSLKEVFTSNCHEVPTLLFLQAGIGLSTLHYVDTSARVRVTLLTFRTDTYFRTLRPTKAQWSNFTTYLMEDAKIMP